MQLFILSLFCFIAFASCVQLTGSRATDAFNALLKGYDKRARPDAKVEVEASAYVIRAYDYCERNSNFKVDMYFRQKWTDSRLARSSLGADELTGGEELREQLWTPDTFFSEDNSGEIGKVLTPNVFVKINASGQVFMSQRVTTRVACDPKIARFPRDIHTCKTVIESYAYTNEYINYAFKNNKVPFGIGGNLTDFTLLKAENTADNLILKDKQYSRLILTFTIQRNAKSYVVRDILPSLLATLVSFVPLFISKRSPQFRILLSALLLASNTVLLTPQIVQKASPRRGALTTADCFFTTSMAFVVAQFLLTSYVTIKSQQDTKSLDVEKIAVVTETSEQLSRINRLGRLTIVGLYVVFNVIYWISFMF